MLPLVKPESPEGKYDIYPSFQIRENSIFQGYESLADRIAKCRFVIVDGYNGAGFDVFRVSLEKILKVRGLSTSWISISEFYHSGNKIEEITRPFLGGDDPLFGTRTSLKLEDFLIPESVRKFSPDTDADICFLFGPGAQLAGRQGFLIYIDIPKNEIQMKARRGQMSNLGFQSPSDPAVMYKYFYFVEWIVLNSHKRSILPSVDIFIDGQREDEPVWIEGKELRNSIREMSRNIFRARPWFEPGAWGGSWIRNNIDVPDRNVPNYAWSFELITPENGLILESSSLLLEMSFDCLMYLEAEAVLGDCFSRFGSEFPIRFDFLDTFDGGNLSIQCHPRPGYTKDHFGEDFTQEECYYILDSKDTAVVNLGFCDDIDPEEFRKELESSYTNQKPVETKRYILEHQVQKHDFFLIPYGTVHGSGSNNMVLEISTTPYIFTFKMYDWLRPDLNGRLRPLNISRAMENLYFERRGKYVKENLIAKPVLMTSGSDFRKYHLPTHETHLYDVYRYHITSKAEIQTGYKCLVMNLVEGKEIEIVTKYGAGKIIHYAETFVIPAAAEQIVIINRSDKDAILVTAFVK